MPCDVKLTRRSFLATSAMMAVGDGGARAASEPRIVALDYGLAQSLIAIGSPPLGLINTPGWADWCVEPELAETTVNLGGATDPNLELIARLKPDLIVSTPYLDLLLPQLQRIAPVERLPIYDVGGSPWQHVIDATKRLGVLTNREAQAEKLIADTNAALAEAKNKLTKLRGKPLLFGRFIDTRHIWIIGPGGIFQDVLDQLGLTNGWRGDTNGWGFAQIGFEELPDYSDGKLFLLDPVPPDVLPALAGNPVWESLGYVDQRRLEHFPKVLMWGTLPSATRFARLLVETSLHA